MAYMKKGCWLPDEDSEGLSYVDTFNDLAEVEADRYHLYVSLACPFAHRPLLVHSLLGLHDSISVSSVAPKRYEQGWAFDAEYPDPLSNKSHLQQIYTAAKPDYSGRITVPVLWDKKRQSIASNDSAGIAQWLAQEWQGMAENSFDLLPEDKLEEVNVLSEWIHNRVNLAVYSAGFATEQAAYDAAFDDVFQALDELEERLSAQRYLHGANITMSDVRLIPSLVRFDSVYYTHFKLNKKRIQDYPNLWGYLLEMMQLPAIRQTVNLEHIKLHYFYAHNFINPHRIVPKGPDIDWQQAHNRDRLS
ncbi:MAG: glutathione S-transferase C-terminal domain-containing protein [Amphritea sp.]